MRILRYFLKKENILRFKRKKRTKTTIKENGSYLRLSVFCSSRHLYVQAIINGEQSKTITGVSTLEKGIKPLFFGCRKIKLYFYLGNILGQRLLNKGIHQVAFDRSGYSYAGCIKSLVRGIRSTGTKI